MMRLTMGILLAAVCLAVWPVHARAWEQTMVPVLLDGETVRLSTIVRRPKADGPRPTLIFLHGSTGYGGDSETYAWVQEFAAVARFFVARGWVVVLPSRRGRGGSEGLYDEGLQETRGFGYTCEPARSLAGAERALRDTDAIVKEVATWPFVDSQRIVIGGVSRGGILSAVYAGDHPKSVSGVINIVGGWAGSCRGAHDMNRALFRRAAAYPGQQLWLYADRDTNYTLDQIRETLAVFRAAGGKAIYHDDFARAVGHSLAAHPLLWQGALDSYLASLSLPTETGFAERRPLVPDSSTSPQRFIGRWKGAWLGVVRTVLTVRSVDANGDADIVYFFRDGNSFPKGRISDGTLELTGSSQRVRFFPMPDGRLRGEFEGSDGSFGTAVLEPAPERN